MGDDDKLNEKLRRGDKTVERRAIVRGRSLTAVWIGLPWQSRARPRRPIKSRLFSQKSHIGAVKKTSVSRLTLSAERCSYFITQ